MKNLNSIHNKRELKALDKILEEVNNKADFYGEMTDEELKGQVAVLRSRLAAGETLDDILPSAYALVREASSRVLHMRHYDVQVLGGIAMHQGRVCEMATGEGKTLTETLPAFLNALTGKGVHIVTSNEYLARRDEAKMRPLYEFLGMKSGCINVKVTDEKGREKSETAVKKEKREAYACDITYGTASEFGFDYLRDLMVTKENQRVQRKEHNFVLIDEADSILIDDARTPLILSSKGVDFDKKLAVLAKIFVDTLKSGYRFKEEDKYEDIVNSKTIQNSCGYIVDEKNKAIELTVGLSDQEYQKDPEDPEDYQDSQEFINSGYGKAEAFFRAQGLIKEGEKLPVEILDYVMKALYAKHILKEGTDYLVNDASQKIDLVDTIGTGRVMDGRSLSDGLQAALEAKEFVTDDLYDIDKNGKVIFKEDVKLPISDEDVAVTQITLQNYFGMYNKKSGMTGTAASDMTEFEEMYNLDVVTIPTNKPIQREDLPPRFFRSKEEKNEAIIKEIIDCHKTGRPVLIGTGSIDESEEIAELLKAAGIEYNLLNAKNDEQEASIIAEAGRKGAVTISTQMAGRGTDIKLGGEAKTQEERARCAKEKEEILGLGGLMVIATSYYESERVDDQLKGRAARQGDPGTSVTFASFDDQFIDLNATSKLRKIMENEKIDISNPRVSRTIEAEIKKMQRIKSSRYLQIKKQAREYDDIANDQRKRFYETREKIVSMNDQELDSFESGMTETYALTVFEMATEVKPDGTSPSLEEVNKKLKEQYNLDVKLSKRDLASKKRATRAIQREVSNKIKSLQGKNCEGFTTLKVSHEDMLRFVLLSVMDASWPNHLYNLEVLRSVTALRALANEKPIDAYTREASLLFEALNQDLIFETLSSMLSRDPKELAAGYMQQKLTNGIELVNAESEEQKKAESPAPKTAIRHGMGSISLKMLRELIGGDKPLTAEQQATKKVEEEQKMAGIKDHLATSREAKIREYEAETDRLTADGIAAAKEVSEKLESTAKRLFTKEWVSEGKNAAIVGTVIDALETTRQTEEAIYNRSEVKGAKTLSLRDEQGKVIASASLFVNEKQGYMMFVNLEISDELDSEEKAEVMKMYQEAAKEYTEEFNSTHSDSQISSVMIAEKNPAFSKLLSEGKSPEEAIKMIKDTKTGIKTIEIENSKKK